MSLPLVDQLHNELRRLLVAGSGLSRGDDSLKRLEPQLRAAARHAPVFAKLADLTQGCHTPPAECDSVSLLLQALVLTDAVRIATADCDSTGVLLPLSGPAADLGTPRRYSELGPLIEALTSPRAGRIETVRRGLRDGPADLRLLPALNTALDDRCADISKMAATALLQWGAACLPLLARHFDAKRGMRGNLRRFVVLALLKDDDAFVLDVLRQGAKPLQKYAAGLLTAAARDAVRKKALNFA